MVNRDYWNDGLHVAENFRARMYYNITKDIHSISNKLSLLHRKFKNKIPCHIKGSQVATVIFLVFASIATIHAIVTVCLTTAKPNQLCQLSFHEVIGSAGYQHSSNPRSLAAGDFNHDKLVDIVVVYTGTNEIAIFLNTGNETFTRFITYTTGQSASTMSVAIGDFNNDTHLDIAVANYRIHNIGIFLGLGNGSFSNQAVFSTGFSCPSSLAVGDMNNDYILDIIVTNNGTNNIGIFFGYGNGSFENLTTYFTGYDSAPNFIAIANLNNDSYRDIAVANYGTDNIGIFLGHGNGSFTNQLTYATGYRSKPYSIVIKDFNNDGFLDIAVANSGTNNIGVFFGYGNGSFRLQQLYSVSPGLRPQSIIAGDIDGDNQSDIAVSNYDTSTISVFIGSQNGNFAAPTTHSTGINAGPCQMIFDDFHNDTQFDIAVVNFEANNLIILIRYSTIQSNNPTSYMTGFGSLPYRIATGDFNNDDQPDLAVVNSAASNVGIFLGYNNGTFREQMIFSTGNHSNPYALAIDDLDSNGQLDIAVATANGESLGILYGYGNGSFETTTTLSTGHLSSPRWITLANFNKDNYVDIAFTDFGMNHVGIFLGYGNRTFKYSTNCSTGDNSNPMSMAIEDINKDGILDIIVANYGTNNVAILVGFENGVFSLSKTYSTGSNSLPYMVNLSDLNKDNYLDIIVANSGTSKVGIFFGFGNGSFSEQLEYSTGTNSIPLWVNIADLNNDNLPDLVVANSNTNNIGVLLGTGHGSFSTQTVYSTGFGSSPKSMSIGDFNKDGYLDLAVANYGSSNIAILLGHPSENSVNQLTTNVTDMNSYASSTTIDTYYNESITNIGTNTSDTSKTSIRLGNYYETFLGLETYSTGSSARPYSFAVGDINADKKLDIIVANSGNENLGILLGHGNGIFSLMATYSTHTGSSPQYVLLVDLNNDTKLDVVFTNPRNDCITVLFGNGNGTFSTEITYSTGSGSKPTVLAIGDFNNDQYVDLVVTNTGTDSIGIFFGLNYTYFARQMPCGNDNYSGPTSVATGDFNNDGYLDIVGTFYDSDNLGIFLGVGNGSFTPVLKYTNLFMSHSWSVTVGDVNNDNQIDIIVADWGNSSVSVALGSGDGNFSKPISYSTGSSSRPVSVTVGDFNDDHNLDIATANFGGSSISILLGYGNGTFANLMIYSTGKGSRSSGIIVSDINNDNITDIIVANLGTDSIGVLIGYGNGSFAQSMTFSTGPNSSPQFVVTGDFNKDGRSDLAIANYGTSDIGILYGYGNGSFGNLSTYTTGTGSHPTNINVGDFNNDRQLDLIVTDEVSNIVGVFFGYNDGTFSSMVSVPLGTGSVTYNVAIADFDNDHYLDFAIAVYGDNSIGIFLAQGSMPFGGPSTILMGKGSAPSSVAVGHLNNDDRLDIVIANSGTNNIGVLFGYGNRLFSNVLTISTGTNSYPSSLALGDFNNDSLTDIAVVNSKTEDIMVFLGYNNGSFYNLVSYSMGKNSQPTSISVSDFNGDNQMDIAVANYGGNNVVILFGIGNGTFTNQTWYPIGYHSQPNWISFADLDNNGRQDVIVAAYGIDDLKLLLNIC